MASLNQFSNGKHDLRRGVDFIGVTCAFFCHDGKGKFLMHKRSKNCRDEQGRWDTGAGALEFGEELEDCIAREVKEEYGADPVEIKFVDSFEVHRQLEDGTPTHWVAFFYSVEVDPKQATNNEPYKIDEIGWFDFGSLPTPLHSMMQRNFAAVKAADGR